MGNWHSKKETSIKNLDVWSESMDETMNVSKNVEAVEITNTKYVVMRYIQILCIGAFVFGALWEGTIKFNLTTPQFLMVYGGAGAVISEVLARIFKKYEKKNITRK